jgi:hypothetical protein
MKPTDSKAHAPACPNSETLTAYLAASDSLPAELASGWRADAIDDDEKRRVAAHLAVCDRCVEDLVTAQRRLSRAAEVPLAVPADVAARAAAAMASTPAAVLRDRNAWIGNARRWLSEALRLPVLVPALAALTLVLVFAPRPQSSPSAPRELSRAVPMRQAARVTAVAASVRTERSPGSEIIANLRRGDSIVLVGEQDGWYRISLADGSEGWIERTAFE